MIAQPRFERLARAVAQCPPEGGAVAQIEAVPYHRVGVEAGLRVGFLEMLLVALHGAQRGPQQGIEPRAGDAGRPSADVRHEQVHLARVEIAVLEEMVGDLQEGEGVELAAGGGRPLFLRPGLGGFRPRGIRSLGLVGGVPQPGLGLVADLAELPVGQLEQGREHVDAALELARNGFLVLDLVVQHAPGILDDGAYLQFEGLGGVGGMLRQACLGGVEAQVQVQPLVAEGAFGAFHGGHLVGHVDHVEVGSHGLGHFFQLVLVQADHAHPDQVGDVVPDLIGSVAFFQRRTVFAGELRDTFQAVLDPAFHLGDVQVGRAREDGLQQGDIRGAGILQGG